MLRTKQAYNDNTDSPRILTILPLQKLEWLSYQTLNPHNRIFIRLDTVPERDGRTDRQTDGQTESLWLLQRSALRRALKSCRPTVVIDHYKTAIFRHLRFCPPSPHSYCSAAGREDTNSLRCACFNARHICSSEYTSNGSRFMRSDPENNTGSCQY